MLATLRPVLLVLVTTLVLGFGGHADLQAQEGSTSQLEALGALMVGTWEAPDSTSRHVNEWGVGRKLIRSRSYFRGDGGWELVSEGIWFPADDGNAVRGIHFAVRMPVERLEYRTEVRGGEVVHELRAHGDSIQRFVETWTFDRDAYRWRLEQPTDQGLERVMGGTYRRVGPGPGGPG